MAQEEDILENNLKAFLPYICDCVKAINLLAHLHYFTREQRKTIFKMCESNEVAAMRRAMEILMNETEDPGRFKAIRDAIESSHYPKIVQMLDGKNVSCDQNFRKIIDLFTSEIIGRLNPEELLPKLVVQGTITNVDAEEVRAEERNHGKTRACWVLLFSLPNRVENWFSNFFEALLDKEYDGIAEILEPDLFKKITEQRKEAVSVSYTPETEDTRKCSLSEMTEQRKEATNVSFVSETEHTRPNLLSDTFEDNALAPDSFATDIRVSPDAVSRVQAEQTSSYNDSLALRKDQKMNRKHRKGYSRKSSLRKRYLLRKNSNLSTEYNKSKPQMPKKQNINLNVSEKQSTQVISRSKKEKKGISSLSEEEEDNMSRKISKLTVANNSVSSSHKRKVNTDCNQTHTNLKHKNKGNKDVKNASRTVITETDSTLTENGKGKIDMTAEAGYKRNKDKQREKNEKEDAEQKEQTKSVSKPETSEEESVPFALRPAGGSSFLPLKHMPREEASAGASCSSPITFQLISAKESSSSEKDIENKDHVSDQTKKEMTEQRKEAINVSFMPVAEYTRRILLSDSVEDNALVPDSFATDIRVSPDAVSRMQAEQTSSYNDSLTLRKEQEMNRKHRKGYSRKSRLRKRYLLRKNSNISAKYNKSKPQMPKKQNINLNVSEKQSAQVCRQSKKVEQGISSLSEEKREEDNMSRKGSKLTVANNSVSSSNKSLRKNSNLPAEYNRSKPQMSKKQNINLNVIEKQSTQVSSQSKKVKQGISSLSEEGEDNMSRKGSKLTVANNSVSSSNKRNANTDSNQTHTNLKYKNKGNKDVKNSSRTVIMETDSTLTADGTCRGKTDLTAEAGYKRNKDKQREENEKEDPKQKERTKCVSKPETSEEESVPFAFRPAGGSSFLTLKDMPREETSDGAFCSVPRKASPNKDANSELALPNNLFSLPNTFQQISAKEKSSFEKDQLRKGAEITEQRKEAMNVPFTLKTEDTRRIALSDTFEDNALAPDSFATDNRVSPDAVSRMQAEQTSSYDDSLTLRKEQEMNRKQRINSSSTSSLSERYSLRKNSNLSTEYNKSKPQMPITKLEDINLNLIDKRSAKASSQSKNVKEGLFSVSAAKEDSISSRDSKSKVASNICSSSNKTKVTTTFIFSVSDFN